MKFGIEIAQTSTTPYMLDLCVLGDQGATSGLSLVRSYR